MSIRTLLLHSFFTLSLLTWVASGVHAQNTLLGTGAGASLTNGNLNTLLGTNAGSAITTGSTNTLVGHEAGEATTGSANTMVGEGAGYLNTTGGANTFLGGLAGGSARTGCCNTYLGLAAGYSNKTGTHNVFVGYHAGFNELGSNKLYIDNSATSAPLIYGDFSNGWAGINGRLGVGTQIPLEKLHVRDGNLLIEQTGALNAILKFVSNGKSWVIKNNRDTGRLTFFSPGGGASTASFKFDRQAVENLLRVGVLAGNTVDINGNLMVTGTFSNPDYVFTPEYDLESIEEHSAYMWEHQHLPAVGQGKVNTKGQAMVNVGKRSQGMLEELEKAHIYIEQLHGEMTETKAELFAVKGEMTTLKAKEAELEKVKSEMAALKVMMHQLMSQNRNTAPGKEG